jgi:hypothetical protein
VEPSGQSAAIALLLELAASTTDARYALAARRALEPLAAQIAARPSGWGALLAALSQPKLAEALEQAGKAEAARTASKGLPDSADHVHAQGNLLALKEGADLVVTVEIDPGYHINANPASDPDLIPTQLMLDGQRDLAVEYPAAHVFKAPFAPQGIAVYEDRITLRAHLPQGAAGLPSTARLRVQACNDQSCLAPATLAVPIGGRPQ